MSTLRPGHRVVDPLLDQFAGEKELAAHAADRQLIVRRQVIHLSLTESQQFGNFARRQKFGFAHEALTREQRV